MTILDEIRLAVSGMRGNAMRAFLSILGLSVGIGAVLTVLALSDAGEMRVEDEISNLGVNKVWIRAKDGTHSLKPSDAQMLEEITCAAACAGVYTGMQVLYRDQMMLVQIAGMDGQMEAVHGIKVLEGRMFSAAEHEQARCVCLVDEVLAQQLGSDVIGKRLTVGVRRPMVIGVIKKMTMQMTSGTGMMIMPISSFFDTLGGNVLEITLSVPRGLQAEHVAAVALSALKDGAFRADTLTKEINAAREIIRIFVMVLFGVAAVCVLTGCIGVMNVLLLSVRERKHEIGLIRAVGGTSFHIIQLFLLEAVAYVVLGSLLGIAAGCLMIQILGAWIGLSAHLRMDTLLPTLGTALMLGVVFGAFPAYMAGTLNPIDALNDI